MEIGQCSRNYTCRESRCVEFMLRVQDQCCRQRLPVQFTRLPVVQQVQEVAGNTVIVGYSSCDFDEYFVFRISSFVIGKSSFWFQKICKNRTILLLEASYAGWQTIEQTAGLCETTALLDAEIADEEYRGPSRGGYSQESIISCKWDSS